MNNLKDIKDRSPNPTLINELKSLLDRAEKGEIRAIAYVQGWDDNAVGSSWVLNAQFNPRAFLGEMDLLHSSLINIINELDRQKTQGT